MWIVLIACGVLLLLLGAVGVLLFSSYNGLVRLRNEFKNAWAQIDVQLKRRHDLIPNLVETVKAYAAHEKEALEAVMAARAGAVSAKSIDSQVQAEGALSGALGRLMMVSEAYPELQANQNFLALQEELTSTENRIGFSRQHFNDQIMLYNTSVESFPSNIVAGLFRFELAKFFEVEAPQERVAPAVKF